MLGFCLNFSRRIWDISNLLIRDLEYWNIGQVFAGLPKKFQTKFFESLNIFGLKPDVECTTEDYVHLHRYW